MPWNLPETMISGLLRARTTNPTTASRHDDRRLSVSAWDVELPHGSRAAAAAAAAIEASDGDENGRLRQDSWPLYDEDGDSADGGSEAVVRQWAGPATCGGGLVEGRSYQTRVRARNARGWGAWSHPSLPCVVTHYQASISIVWEGDLQYFPPSAAENVSPPTEAGGAELRTASSASSSVACARVSDLRTASVLEREGAVMAERDGAFHAAQLAVDQRELRRTQLAIQALQRRQDARDSGEAFSAAGAASAASAGSEGEGQGGGWALPAGSSDSPPPGMKMLELLAWRVP